MGDAEEKKTGLTHRSLRTPATPSQAYNKHGDRPVLCMCVPATTQVLGWTSLPVDRSRGFLQPTKRHRSINDTTPVELNRRLDYTANLPPESIENYKHRRLVSLALELHYSTLLACLCSLFFAGTAPNPPTTLLFTSVTCTKTFACFRD